MSTYPEASGPGTGSAEVGPPPYYHRSDCHICRKQDGLKTGSKLLDAPIPGGYIVETEHFLVEHAPLQESSAGTVIVEARRHLLGLRRDDANRKCRARFDPPPAHSGDQGRHGGRARLLPGGHGALAPLSTSGSYRGRATENFGDWTTSPSSPHLHPRTARQKRCRARSELNSIDPDESRAVIGAQGPRFLIGRS